MILRKCFPTAVFFSVGIAFAIAEEPVDEDMFRETTYTFDISGAAERFNTYNLSFSKTTGTKAGDATLLEANGFDEAGSGRNDYTTGHENDGGSLTFQEDSASVAPDRNELRNIYDLSVSSYDSIPEGIGFIAHKDVDNPLVFTDIIAEAPNNFQLPNQETISLLSFDRNVFTRARNWGQILSGYYYEVGKKENELVLFGSMITIPFACLTVALGVGFLLIMFTSIGNKTND